MSNTQVPPLGLSYPRQPSHFPSKPRPGFPPSPGPTRPSADISCFPAAAIPQSIFFLPFCRKQDERAYSALLPAPPLPFVLSPLATSSLAACKHRVLGSDKGTKHFARMWFVFFVWTLNFKGSWERWLRHTHHILCHSFHDTHKSYKKFSTKRGS